MAAITLYDTAVAPLMRSMKALSSLLKKGEAFADAKGIAHSELLEGRLAPDMLPLTFQVQTVSNTAKFIAVRVAGAQNVTMEDNEKTFEELQTRITKTLEYLEALKREDFDGKEGSEVIFRDTKFTGLSYTTNFAIPNFYFHMTTAYAIMRMKGVDVGKLDYMGAR